MNALLDRAMYNYTNVNECNEIRMGCFTMNINTDLNHE